MQTRLEPSRTTLSSRPFERVKPVAPAVVSPAPTRKCCACGKEDVVHILQGQYDERGEPLIDHSVTLDLKYLKKPEEFTPRMQAKGWKYRIWQGRPAMERFICIPCLEGQREMQREFRSKLANERRSSVHGDSYYMALCGD